MHIEGDRLQDYVDELVDAQERNEVEGHLAVCPRCFEDVQKQRSLLGDLSKLPRRMAPRRDLLPGIHAAIDAEKVRPLRVAQIGGRTLRSARYHLAAAAIVLLVLSSAATVLVLRAGGWVTGGTVVGTLPAIAPEEFRALEANYVAATAELEEVLRDQRAALAPETVRILEENLAIIDRALAEASAALRADPGNPALSEMVVAAYEKKLDLLRRAADVPLRRGA
jgi:hypothetical protein